MSLERVSMRLLRPRTKFSVWLFAGLTSLISVVVTAIAVPLTFDLLDDDAVFKSCLIAMLCAFPTALILFDGMRKNEELSAKLQKLVNRDRLTDVATRDYFFQRMEEAPDCFGVSLMIDIDHFKQVNDTYGHLFGDQVIHRVADVLRTAVRKEDIVCRFGGEEFVVFLEKYDAESGMRVAERIREQVQSQVMEHEGVEVRVTVSIGGALKDGVSEIEKSIQDADEALYVAKSEGRNRTVFHNMRKAA